MHKARILLILLIFSVLLSLTSSHSLAQQTLIPLSNSSFSVESSIFAAPDPFGKQSPINGAIDQPVSDLTLQWHASSTPNITYQYCLRANANCPSPKWISVGTNTSVTVSGLSPNTKYYWQVRAVDSQNNYTYADTGTLWNFTTMQVANFPGPFNKLTPADAATDQPINNLALTWSASSLATSYQYCYDTVNNNTCDTAWTNVSGLSATVSGFSYATTYYWQVRAVNASGNVQADAGTWFYFQTQLEPPGAFGKTSPADFAVNQTTSLTLSWGASPGSGITYQYCLDTAPCSAGSGWTPAGTNLFASVSGLANGTTTFSRAPTMTGSASRPRSPTSSVRARTNWSSVAGAAWAKPSTWTRPSTSSGTSPSPGGAVSGSSPRPAGS